MKLIKMILKEMINVSKPQKQFFELLMSTIVSMYGRVNFRGLARWSGMSEKSFRRWFKKVFDFSQFNSRAIDKVVTKDSELIAAFDQSFTAKTGKGTWGKDWFYNGSLSQAAEGLELVLCAIIDVGKNLAYALTTEQTPPANELKAKEKQSELTRIDFYLECVGRARMLISKYTTTLVCDGYFTKKKFVDGIIEMGFTFIGKLRIDANLKMLYSGPQTGGRGRPKKFAGKCNIGELQGFAFEKDVDDKTKLYSGIFYHPSLARNVKVVAVKYSHTNRTGTALLFSTNLLLDAFQIFRYYKARFQMEFIFRDAKQYTGLGDSQSRNKESINYHFNASFTALNLVKIQEQIDRQGYEKTLPFSMASHKIRNHNKTVIELFFSKLGLDLNLIKSNPTYHELLNYGTISAGRC